MYRCRPGHVVSSRSATFPVASSSDPSETVISTCSATDAVAWMTDPRARSKSAVRLRVGIVIDSRGAGSPGVLISGDRPEPASGPVPGPLSDQVGGTDQAHARRPTCGRQVPRSPSGRAAHHVQVVDWIVLPAKVIERAARLSPLSATTPVGCSPLMAQIRCHGPGGCQADGPAASSQDGPAGCR
jgi:hypothetical protein